MPQKPLAQSADQERAELERVVEVLAQWPRLSRLFRYMGEKLFSGEVDHLTEYNIATEVLGRSKTLRFRVPTRLPKLVRLRFFLACRTRSFLLNSPFTVCAA